LRALRQAPGMFYRPSFVHKLFYCLYGGSSVYERTRAGYRRTRASLAG
jgi:hypothetical protein